MNNCELADSVKSSLDQYFKDLDGESPHALYDMVLGCIRKTVTGIHHAACYWQPK